MAFKTNLVKAKEQLALIKKKKEEREAKKGSAKLEPGVTELRVAPAYSEAGEWNCGGFFHYGFTDDEGPVLCPTTYGEDCPICEFVTPLWRGSDEDKEQAKAIGRKLRYYINAKLIAVKKSEEEIVKYDNPRFKILPLPESVVTAIGNLMEDWGDITDFKTGRNIRITREGKGFTTKYKEIAVRPNPSEVENTGEAEKQIANLHDYVYKNKKTYEQLTAILATGGTPEETEDTSEGSTATETPAEPQETPAKAKDDWDDAPVMKSTTPTKTEEKPTRQEKESAKDETKKSTVKDAIAKLRAKQAAAK